jgi:hypothetical protein
VCDFQSADDWDLTITRRMLSMQHAVMAGQWDKFNFPDNFCFCAHKDKAAWLQSLVYSTLNKMRY